MMSAQKFLSSIFPIHSEAHFIAPGLFNSVIIIPGSTAIFFYFSEPNNFRSAGSHCFPASV